MLKVPYILFIFCCVFSPFSELAPVDGAMQSTISGFFFPCIVFLILKHRTASHENNSNVEMISMKNLIIRFMHYSDFDVK